MNSAYEEIQHNKENVRTVYSANNPYAYAEQYHGDHTSTQAHGQRAQGHFENGNFIASDDHAYAHGQDTHKQAHDNQPRGMRPHTKPTPRGILPSIMRSEHLCISDLHWWTAHHHILQACQQAGVLLTRNAITSAEHKVNGKSKGCVYLTCKSSDDAQKIGAWFRDNEFQGKKMPTAFASRDAIRALKTPAAISSNPRPATGSLTSLANHPPTNAHGGINFNRLRQHNRGYGGNVPTTGMGINQRSQKGAEVNAGSSWHHQIAWNGMEHYQSGPMYMQTMHGMLPYMSAMDPSMYGLQGDHHYQ